MIDCRTIQYTAVIRTLGQAGAKYQQLLDSLVNQTNKPHEILVYIAEGYSIPKETVGIEKYIYVSKGMVAQRALDYREVQTDYVLFLDDDVYLPPTSVQILFEQLVENNADVISPDVFENSKRPFKTRLLMTLSGRMYARRNDCVWGYKVMKSGGYSYNYNPRKDVYLSQTNAGPCFLCKKSTMLSIHFDEELWLDMLGYAQGDDQVMFYKMYKKGYKQLTSYNSGIVHLDAGGNRNIDKEKMLIYSDFRFKVVFWHRFIFKPEKRVHVRIVDCLVICYTIIFALLVSLVKLRVDIFRIKLRAIIDASYYIKGKEYKSLPTV